MKQLISTGEAEGIILSSSQRASTEFIPLADAGRRILRQSILADRDCPPFHRVMMDGIALSHSHLQTNTSSIKINIEGIQAAGTAQTSLQSLTSAIEVMTGAPLPEGTDCVIPVEQYDIQEGKAVLHNGYLPDKNQFIHHQGSDSKQGSPLLSSGLVLGPAELGIAASVGITQLEVSALPKLTILTTGDEVIDPKQTPLPHQIRRSHPSVLTELLISNKLAITTHQHLPDDLSVIHDHIQTSLEHSDILVLTGGVSKGKYDYVAPALRQILGDPLFHGVAQRPGKPFAYWRNESKQVFALPGNPVSVLATATRYLLPALQQYLGAPTRKTKLPLAQEVEWDSPLTGLIASTIVNGKIHLKPPANSGDYTALAGITGFTELSADTQGAKTLSVHFPMT